MLLEVKNAAIQFGGLKVIEDLNIKMERGQLVGLIGPNGAGKTTAFNLISGIYLPTAGDIYFEGVRINDLKAHSVAQLGVIRTFQNIRLFPTLSVLDNILVSRHKDGEYGLWAALTRTKRFRASERRIRDEARAMLELFHLQDVIDHEAGSLPYGVQRKVEIVRALAGRPKLLLLDEPAAGMNHGETDELMALIERIRTEFKLAVLLIEHDMKLVMNICERILVLDHGEIIAEGAPNEIQQNRRVIEAYLGVEDDDA